MANGNLQIVSVAGNREGHKILLLKGSLNLQSVFEFQNVVRAETAPVGDFGLQRRKLH
jgi:hypothetical protein